MSTTQLLPTAQEALKKLVLAEEEKARAEARQKECAALEKKALIDRLLEPSGISEEAALERAAAIINRAVNNGLAEVEVLRFPNSLCTDHGRAINNNEPGWENTLTGLPKEMYQFWDRNMRPLGYKVRVQIVDWPGGLPGDIAVTLKWGE